MTTPESSTNDLPSSQEQYAPRCYWTKNSYTGARVMTARGEVGLTALRIALSAAKDRGEITETDYEANTTIFKKEEVLVRGIFENGGVLTSQGKIFPPDEFLRQLPENLRLSVASHFITRFSLPHLRARYGLEWPSTAGASSILFVSAGIDRRLFYIATKAGALLQWYKDKDEDETDLPLYSLEKFFSTHTKNQFKLSSEGVKLLISPPSFIKHLLFDITVERGIGKRAWNPPWKD